jgi:erythromycin esterase-like protein
MASVLNYLQKVDAAAADTARGRYSEFPGFSGGGNSYNFADLMEVPDSCIEGAIKEALEIQLNRYTYLAQQGLLPTDAQFSAEQNAYIIARAEEYYRRMFSSQNSAWNLRETHMCDTLYRLLKHLETSRKTRPKIIVWAHNTHIGDARNHEMARNQELSIGQLLRENPSIKTLHIGFTTSTGTVAAASYWQGEVSMRALPAPKPDSVEAIFSSTGLERFLLYFRDPLVAWSPF